MAGNLLLMWSGDSEKRLFILLLLIVGFVGLLMLHRVTSVKVIHSKSQLLIFSMNGV